ncbi:Rv0361 family membrane protein [Mycolicibacterium brumae]|uniref:DUF4878 domain-containing protein n=1 Tax=Mycolicibacterium brumae TaxID=85968 RepID=A0A2G5PGG8_9MYCO|nr:DUF4878 domain-containing protein [Mycolicibacterium brumae]MCV7192602.1 DUF4878 domain-containing protein [Mycolicibacterium brumae]PIB77412.1 DUF4878 domain-containing protein [Mycolicibacterium brumae]RWA18406.1 hypothetical protein MBRU_04110 [Mycolicibacterium brumae DSM 44177]UWW10372.1 DUF4878 domain-containing protein [Mycolicibacterium brumae]
MSTPSEPGPERPESGAGADPGQGDAATEIFAPAEEPAEDERRYTAPSAFDGSTQIIGTPSPDPATEIIGTPAEVTAAAGATQPAMPAPPRPAGPQAIPPRPATPAESAAQRRHSWGWVLALLLVIAALVAVAILVIVLFARSGDKAQVDQVRDTIETYNDAVTDGDLTTLRSVTCGGYDDFDDDQWQAVHTQVVDAKQNPVVYSIDEIVVNGDHAEANVTSYIAADPSETSIRSFDLVKTDGQWKIC